MRIFEKDGKINFVDENNVIVGFDYSACCCEQFGYIIADQMIKTPGGSCCHTCAHFHDGIRTCDNRLRGAIGEEGQCPEYDEETKEVVQNCEGFVFDTNFFQEIRDYPAAYEEGAAAVFRLKKNGEVRYLHLFNVHNGYYSHGFEMNVGGQTIHEGSL